MLRVADLDVKELILADDRGIFFTTPHFKGYPAVLLRIPDLGRLDREELEDMVVEAWLTRAPKRVAKAWLAEHARGLGGPEAQWYGSSRRRLGHAIPQVRDGRRREHARRLQPDRLALAIVEQPHAASRAGPERRGPGSRRAGPPRRYCWATLAPPASATLRSSAAARACSSADSIPSVTKVNVVPPSMTAGSRGCCVSTKTGTWNGGSSPHHPSAFGSSLHGPSPPLNIRRPMITAPVAATCSATTSSSTPV